MDIQARLDPMTNLVTIRVLTPGRSFGHEFTGTLDEVHRPFAEVLVPFVQKRGDLGQAQDFRAEVRRMLLALQPVEGSR